MGAARRITIHSFPTWVRTLDLSLEFGDVQIQGWCSTCGGVKAVDFEKLRAIKGGNYSLINRRTRCKLTPGCTGWVRFHYLHGVFRPLWDDDTGERWMDRDWEDRRKAAEQKSQPEKPE